MMMECPRCAFVQPEDRFCANCGLNIATYQAKPKPFIQRLISNPALYFGLAVFFVFVVGWYFKQSKIAVVERPIVEQNTPVTGGAMPGTTPTPPPAAAAASPPPTPAPPPPAPPIQQPQAESRRAETANAVTEPTVTESTTAATEAPAPSPAAPIVRMPPQVEISFYEVARDTWQPLAQEGKSLGDQGGWRVLQFGTKEKLNAVLGGARRLPGQRSMTTQASSSASLHFPSGPIESHQGLYFDFSVVKSETASLDMEVTGQIALKIDATTEIQNRLETVAAMPASGAIVLVGSITRKDPPDALAPQLTSSPLSILNSPDYIEGLSELILVISGR